MNGSSHPTTFGYTIVKQGNAYLGRHEASESCINSCTDLDTDMCIASWHKDATNQNKPLTIYIELEYAR